MPKIKTHRGAAKRFKKTASGKYKSAHAFLSHLLGKKTAKRKRRLRKSNVISNAEYGKLRRLLPYW